jgi:hypothetical protein
MRGLSTIYVKVKAKIMTNFKFTFTEEVRFWIKSLRKNSYLHFYEYIKPNRVTMFVHWTLLLSSGML